MKPSSDCDVKAKVQKHNQRYLFHIFTHTYIYVV